MPTTTTQPGIENATRDQLTPLYNVVLLDDDDHTYDYVIEMLTRIFLISAADAYRHAVEVDSMGRTVVLTCELPLAEYSRDQIQSYGPDPRMPKCKGSMSAVVEPVSSHGGIPA
jgi:ATP-dependent Clp protease adaptor protein ClpS